MVVDQVFGFWEVRAADRGENERLSAFKMVRAQGRFNTSAFKIHQNAPASTKIE